MAFKDLKEQLIRTEGRQLDIAEFRGTSLAIGPNHPVNWCAGPARFPIVTANPGGDYFEIDGDYTDRFALEGDIPGRLYVVGSTGNDNLGLPYSLTGATLVSGKTRITVDPALSPVPSSTADGFLETYEVIVLPAAYEVPLLPTKGTAIGARGETLEWGVPRMVKTDFEIELKDYDRFVIETLHRWRHERLALRIFAAGEFTAVGFVGPSSTLKRPLPDKVNVTLQLRGIRLFKMPRDGVYGLVTYVDGVPTNKVPVLTCPFRVLSGDSTVWGLQTELYGSEVI